jgi:hypothetical protein
LVALRVGVTVQVVELADVDEAFFASAGKVTAAHRERRDRMVEKGDRSDPGETRGPVELHPPALDEPEAPAPPVLEITEVASSAVSAPEAAPVPPAESTDDAEARRRGRRDERPSRVTSPAEQAWGQPIGTPRLAPLPAPVILDSPTSAPETEEPGEAKEEHPPVGETD